MNEHEVLVETKEGKQVVVNVAYYHQNKSRLKMVDGGTENKMDEDPLKNKAKDKAK